MLANARDARRRMMRTNDLHPPRSGLNADPVLYGVAAGLAALFPPVSPYKPRAESSRSDAPDPTEDTANNPTASRR
jgi:hypothetical protein